MQIENRAVCGRLRSGAAVGSVAQLGIAQRTHQPDSREKRADERRKQDREQRRVDRRMRSVEHRGELQDDHRADRRAHPLRERVWRKLGMTRIDPESQQPGTDDERRHAQTGHSCPTMH